MKPLTLAAAALLLGLSALAFPPPASATPDWAPGNCQPASYVTFSPTGQPQDTLYVGTCPGPPPVYGPQVHVWTESNGIPGLQAEPSCGYDWEGTWVCQDADNHAW